MTCHKQASGWLYSARDLAVVRASQSDVPIILGSATPALESLQQVNKGNYQEINLTKRATKQALPSVQLLDVRKLPMQEGLSRPLLDKIETNLALKGEQVMVFLNRRGYAPVLMCHDCGWLAECQRCHSHYTLHRSQNQLRCHHCDASGDLLQPIVQNVTRLMSLLSVWEQSVSRNFLNAFSEYPLIRIDRDSTRKKDAMHNYVQDINSGKYQLLMGTQMLAKGHHFPNLDVSGYS